MQPYNCTSTGFTMTGRKHLLLLLLTICAVIKFDVVKGCLRTPEVEEFERLKEEVRSLRAEHEALKQNQRNSGHNHKESSDFVQLNNDLLKLKTNVEQLLVENSKKESVSSTELKNEIMKGLDALRKEVDVKVDSTKNQMKETHDKIDGQFNEIWESLKEIDGLVKKVKHQLSDAVVSLLNLNNETKTNFSTVQQSLNDLAKVVTSDLKAKVAEFYSHIEAIQQSKEEADKILSDTQLVVDKIRPNTFNKGAAVTAFLILVILVFILVFWVYNLQQKIEKMSKIH